MNIKKSSALKYLENISGGELTIGKLIEAIRLGEEISQTEFAKRLKISRSHLCDIEKERKGITPERAARFANILGYSEKLFVSLVLQDMVDKAGLDYEVKLKVA
jgi:antitoxin HigA-1